MSSLTDMLTNILPKEMDSYDVELFRQAVAVDPRHLVPLDVVKRINEGGAMLWRLEKGRSRGIFVVILSEEFGIRELFVWLMAGKNLNRVFREFSESFDKIAEYLGCDFISSAVVNDDVAVVLKRMGFVQQSRMMARRVPNGRV